MSIESDANPYASPSSPGRVNQGSSTNGDRVDFGDIVRRWERLRWYYNGFLTAVVLLLTTLVFPHRLANLGFWVAVLFGAIIANLCFFTGPAIEGYGTYFRLWNRAFTVLLFLAGLGLATVLAIASVATFSTF